jgi:hypothetical protein
MEDIRGYLVIGVLITIVLLLSCYLKISIKFEAFGTDNKPFEPENTLLHRNPWDDIDYIVPVFKINGEKYRD